MILSGHDSVCLARNVTALRAKVGEEAGSCILYPAIRLISRTFPPPIEPSRTFPNHQLFFGGFSGRAKKTKRTKT